MRVEEKVDYDAPLLADLEIPLGPGGRMTLPEGSRLTITAVIVEQDPVGIVTPPDVLVEYRVTVYAPHITLTTAPRGTP